MVSFDLNVAEELDCAQPKSYSEAITGSEKEQRLNVIEEKLESSAKNGTWVIVDKPKRVKCVDCRWIFKKKIEVGKMSLSDIRPGWWLKGLHKKRE